MTIQTFADAEKVLAEIFDGYTPRPQQQVLAAGMEELLNSRDPYQLLAEAGCGVGKSFASVIPAILSGRKVIVATATKALQEQYANKDMPFLQENLPVAFTWALLKGRINYVCQAKMAEANTLQIPNLAQIREELETEGHSGDFEHLLNQVEENKRYLLSTSSEECPGKKRCPFGEICFSEKAKKKAQDADVVITNTAMLMTDARLREITGDGIQMLGEIDAVVIDEAHELPEIAAGALAERMTRRGVETILSAVQSFLVDHDGAYDAADFERAEKAVEKIWTWLADLNRGQNPKINPGDQVEIVSGELMDNIDAIVEMIEVLEVIEGSLIAAQVRNGDPSREGARKNRLRTRLVTMKGRFTELVMSVVNEGTPDEIPYVRWVESEESRRGDLLTHLYWSPVEVGPFLRRVLWTKYPVALVSATLSVGGDFEYIKETLGLTAAAELNVGTPFDYSTQAMLFVPDKTQPSPSGRTRAVWEMYSKMTTMELVKAAGGGALLLFTSRRNMKDTFDALSPELAKLGITCLMQGEHGTNKELSKTFSEDTHSVLFALKSFMTGVDFAGETCRLVIVDKLPFPVPTEMMFAARANLLNSRAGRDVSFQRLTIPMMTLTLVQAYGRLIRSHTDRGIVAILDPRLSSSGYGKGIVKSLPPSPVTTDLGEATGFFSA